MQDRQPSAPDDEIKPEQPCAIKIEPATILPPPYVDSPTPTVSSRVVGTTEPERKAAWQTTLTQLTSYLKQGFTAEMAFDKEFDPVDPTWKSLDKATAKSLLEGKQDIVHQYLLEQFARSKNTQFSEFFASFYQNVWIKCNDAVMLHFKQFFPNELLLDVKREIVQLAKPFEEIFTTHLLPVCTREMPTVNIMQLYKNFELHKSPLGHFLSTQLTPSIVITAEICIFKAIRSGYDAKEFFDKYLLGFSALASQENIRKIFIMGDETPKLAPERSCLLRAFLASKIDYLGDFINHLFEKVLVDRNDELEEYFYGLTQIQVFIAIKHGLKFNDPLEKVMEAFFNAGQAVANAILMTFMNNDAENSFETFLRMEVKRNQRMLDEIKDCPAEVNAMFRKGIADNHTPGDVLRAHYNPVYTELSRKELKQFSQNMRFLFKDDRPQDLIVKKFLQQKQYKMFYGFFKALYYRQKAEVQAEVPLSSNVVGGEGRERRCS